MITLNWVQKLTFVLFDLLTGIAIQSPATNCAYASEPPAKDGTTSFTVRSITPAPNGRGYVGLFEFRNNSNQPISLPGEPGAHAGSFIPAHVGFELQQGQEWVPLHVGYCGLPNEFIVAPHSRCLLEIDLFAFKEAATPIVGRVQVGAYISDSFTLDWVGDRASGAFIRARQEYVERIRQRLRDAGFMDSVLNGDDFCTKLVQRLLGPAESGTLGFAPFQGESDLLPDDTAGGNLRFYFHSKDLVGTEYRYGGLLVLNTSTFTQAWFRASAAAHSKVGTWGQGRTLAIDDESGFWTDRNRLYLEVKYFVPASEPLPDIPASEDLLARIVRELDGCLEGGAK